MHMAAVQERSLGCARDNEAGKRMGFQGWRAVFLDGDTRIPSSKKRRRSRPCESIRSPNTVIPSEAEGSLLHCRHMHTCALTQTTPWRFFSPFPRSRFTALQEGSLYFGPHDTQERRIVSYRFSYHCVELCLFEALYPAPSARPFSKGLLISLL